jgi:Uma2 family endonuclease
MITDISLLDPNKTYTYADYLMWRFQERVELIKGKIYRMSPAPARRHQKISIKLSRILLNYFDNKKCEVYTAPFDVRLPLENNNNPYTVVQPDLCVICDLNKLDDQGCNGAPDFIIEISSPRTAQKDVQEKFEIYQEAGVREYWIVAPEDEMVDVFLLNEENKYIHSGKYANQDRLKVNIFNDLEIDLTKVFA